MTAAAEQGYGVPTQCGGALCPLPGEAKNLVQSVKNWRQRCGGMSVGGQRWLRRATTLDPPGRDARCNFRCRRLSNAVRSILQGSPKTIVRKHEDQHDGVR
jgi:hypothetical protein